MAGYGQFCPVAKAAEVVGERWTPLVLRELVAGSRRFNDLRRGVPLMSPSLLSKRLKTLVAAGVVERRPAGRATEYHLTPAGQELAPMIELLGTWGQRWTGSRFGPEDLDPALLMWDMRRGIQADAFPPGRTVVQFHYPDAPKAKRTWWVISEAGEADLCLTDPGFEVDLFVTADVRILTMIWMGARTLDGAVAAGEVEIVGPSALTTRFGRWLGLSRYAGVAPGSKA